MISLLPISINKLHEHCADQADLFRRASDYAADLQAQAERKRLQEKEVRAEIALQCRADPKSFGVAKVTESVVAAVVDNNELVKEVSREVIRLKRAANKASAIKDAFEHRKSMLRNETMLYSANYWGEVNVKTNKSDAQLMEDEIVSRSKQGRMGEE